MGAHYMPPFQSVRFSDLPPVRVNITGTFERICLSSYMSITGRRRRFVCWRKRLTEGRSECPSPCDFLLVWPTRAYPFGPVPTAALELSTRRPDGTTPELEP